MAWNHEAMPRLPVLSQVHKKLFPLSSFLHGETPFCQRCIAVIKGIHFSSKNLENGILFFCPSASRSSIAFIKDSIVSSANLSITSSFSICLHVPILLPSDFFLFQAKEIHYLNTYRNYSQNNKIVQSHFLRTENQAAASIIQPSTRHRPTTFHRG